MMADRISSSGDDWEKGTILRILLGNPLLLEPKDKAYRDWVLLGADLNIPGPQLKVIKKAAKAQGTGVLYGVVVQVISEWFEEKTRKGEKPSVQELIVNLKKNDLDTFGEALELELVSKAEADARHRQASSTSQSSISAASETITAAENDLSNVDSSGSNVPSSSWTTPPKDYRALMMTEEPKKRFAPPLSPEPLGRNSSPPENVRRRRQIYNYNDDDDDTLPTFYERKLQNDLNRLHDRETVKWCHNDKKIIDQEPSCSRNVGVSKEWKRKYENSSSSDDDGCDDGQDKYYGRSSFEFSQGRSSSFYEGGERTGSSGSYPRSVPFSLHSGASGSAKVNRYHFDTNGLSNLHRAVKENRREDVIRLLEGGADVNEETQDKHRSTPLHIATWTIPNRDDGIEMLKILISRKAKLDVMNAFNCPFTDGLFYTGGILDMEEITHEQFQDFLKFLIDSDHEKFLRIQWGCSRGCLLHWGMQKGALGRQTIKFLRERNINLNCKSDAGHNILYYAIWGQRSIGTIKELIDNGVDWRNRTQMNWNLLHAAARFCHLEAFKYFLKREPKFASEITDNIGKRKTPADLLRKYHPGNEYAAKMLALLDEYKVKV